MITLKSKPNQSAYSTLVENGLNPKRFNNILPKNDDIYKYHITYGDLKNDFNLTDVEIYELYGNNVSIKKDLPIQYRSKKRKPKNGSMDKYNKKQRLSKYSKYTIKMYDFEYDNVTVKSIIEDLYNLNYIENSFNEQKHELLLMSVFRKHGLILCENGDNDNKDRLEILKNPDNMNKKVPELDGKFLFVYQPFGTQKAPDFIICVDGFILWVEAKSTTSVFQWNSNYPRKGMLYVFTHKKKDKTTLFVGDDHLYNLTSVDFATEYENYRKEVQEASNISSSKICNGLFTPYNRPMLVKDPVKYTIDSTRNDLYEKVLIKLNL